MKTVEIAAEVKKRIEEAIPMWLWSDEKYRRLVRDIDSYIALSWTVTKFYIFLKKIIDK